MHSDRPVSESAILTERPNPYTCIRDVVVELPDDLAREVGDIFVEHMVGIVKRPGRRRRVPQPLSDALAHRRYPLNPDKALWTLRRAKPAAMAIFDDGRLRVGIVTRQRLPLFVDLRIANPWHPHLLFDASLRWCIARHWFYSVMYKYRPEPTTLDRWLRDPEAAARIAAAMGRVADFAAGVEAAGTGRDVSGRAARPARPRGSARR